MYLKKEFLQIPFSKIKTFNLVYEDDEDLKLGIIKLIETLKINKLVVELFLQDDMNKLLKKYEVINIKNFNYYLVDNLNFLKSVHLSELRFMSIYSYQLDNFSSNNIDQITNKADLKIGFDNYLEYTMLHINIDKYRNLISNFNG